MAVDALLMWDVRFNENDADDPKDMALEVDIGNRLEFVFEKKNRQWYGLRTKALRFLIQLQSIKF